MENLDLSPSQEKSSKLATAWKWTQRLLPVLALIVFGLAIYFIHHLLQKHSWREIASYVQSIPPSRSMAAIGLTILSYTILSLYDFMGFAYIQKKLSYARIAFASFTAFAFSNNIGLANLAGSSIRLRIYSNYGVEPRDILKVIVFVSASFWIGFFCLAGVMLTVSPLPFPPEFRLSNDWVRATGVILSVLGFGYLGLCAFYKKPITIRGEILRVPPFGLSVAQAAVAAFDWTIACLVLYLLLPAGTNVSFPQFLSIFISAQVLAFLAHVPGGVGVLEALVIYFVAPDHQGSAGILAALLSYRVIYYILPLIVASTGLAVYEGWRQRVHVRRLHARYLSWTGLFIPHVASVLTFLAGALLILSSVTPSEGARLVALYRYVPETLANASHFLGACIGATLLVLSRALLSRSRAAWLLTLLALGAGAAFAILKGFGVEEAAGLLFCAAILGLGHSQFHRKSLLLETPSASWFVAVSMVIGGSIWLGYFVHHHADFNGNFMWEFSSRSDLPRYLRASVGIAVTAVLLSLFFLVRPKNRTSAPTDFKAVERIAKEAGYKVGLDASKSFLLNEAKDAFLAYCVRDSVWIALGDPIGNTEAFEDLVFDFQTLAHANRGEVVFYRVTSEDMPLYLDLGLLFAKLGEEGALRPRFLAYSAKLKLTPLIKQLTQIMARNPELMAPL